MELMSGICIKILNINVSKHYTFHTYILLISDFSIPQDPGLTATEEEEFYLQGKYLFLLFLFFFNMNTT